MNEVENISFAVRALLKMLWMTGLIVPFTALALWIFGHLILCLKASIFREPQRREAPKPHQWPRG